MGIYGQLKRRMDDILFLRANSKSVDIGLFNKIRMWRRGFVSESYLLHSFKSNDPGDYVTDIVRLRKACRFNGYFAIMLMDKLYLSKMLSGFPEHLPTIYGLIRNRRWHRLDGTPDEGMESLMDLCRVHGAIVIKPIVGARGENVLILRWSNDQWMLNREVLTREAAMSAIEKLDGYLATEFVIQHEYSAQINRVSTNTARVLTLWDDETNGPFVAAAVHRFGTSRSAPLDNWTAGGLSAVIDVETGVVGKAISYPQNGCTQCFYNHPETLQPIDGVCVPGWDNVKRRILTMARTLPFVPYIGWDIVITADGFKVIEGNNCPGINLMQVHWPLMRDARIRKFYERRLSAVNGNGKVRHDYKLPIQI